MESLFGILFGILIISVLSFLFGLCLSILAKTIPGSKDSLQEKISAILPGINCGICGYSSCNLYADAILKKETEIDLCKPGSHKIKEKINHILGRTEPVKMKYVAKIFCLGISSEVSKDYIFNGNEDCTTLYNFFNGEKSCKYGCLGKGNCISVCPTGAIKYDQYNRVWIDERICNGCEKCLNVCPTKVIKMVPVTGSFFVACSSPEPMKRVKQICKKGCTGCLTCEKIMSSQGITVIENLASVNYHVTIDLSPAVMRCPAKVIIPIINQNELMNDKKLVLK